MPCRTEPWEDRATGPKKGPVADTGGVLRVQAEGRGRHNPRWLESGSPSQTQLLQTNRRSDARAQVVLQT